MPPAAASLAALATGFLLRSSGAFILPPTGADGSSTPIHRETDHVSTVAPRAGAHDGRYRRPEFIGWGRVVGKTELPGGILYSTSNSVVDGETTPNKDENKITASMTSVLVGRSSPGGGETAMDVEVSGEEGGGGGEGGLWKGRWKNGLRKTVGVIAPILKRGSPQTAEGGQDQQQQQQQQVPREMVAATSAATTSSLVGQKLPSGGWMTPAVKPREEIGWHSYPTPRDVDPNRKQKIVIIVSETGGSHYSSALNLRAAFGDLFLHEADVDICTLHEPGLLDLNPFVGLHRFMSKRPVIGKVMWELSRFPPTRKVSEELRNIRDYKRCQELFESFKPDLVVSVHHECQEVPLRVLQNMGGGTREIPFVTVLTDLAGAHPNWFHPGVDACFVPSEQLATLARKCGLAPNQVWLHGLPLCPGFWRELSTKPELQNELGLKPGVKACLVMGGRGGGERLEDIVDSVVHRLGQEMKESQVVVVCGGKNKAVKAFLDGRNWPSNVHVHVENYISGMHLWMGAVDCIVTKAGPGIIAEAMIQGLPIMLSACFPGQEGNVPYVTEGGFGYFSRKPDEIADTVCKWLRDDDLLAKMGANAKRASRPNATYQICEDIGDILFGGNKFMRVRVRGIPVIDASVVE